VIRHKNKTSNSGDFDPFGTPPANIINRHSLPPHFQSAESNSIWNLEIEGVGQQYASSA
jgi:hypothetical protein